METKITSYMLMFVVLAILELDVLLLKKLNKTLFVRLFEASSVYLWLVSFALAYLSFSFDPPHQGLMLGLISGILPFYLLRRSTFIKTIQSQDIMLDPKAWLTLDAYWVVMMWFFVVGVTSFVIDTAFSSLFKGNQDLWQIMLGTITASGAMIALIVCVCRRLGGKDFWENVGFVKTEKPKWLIVTTASLLAVLFGYVSVSVILARKGQPETPIGRLLEGQPAGTLIFFLALAVIFAPLAEEIIFRGYFFETLRKTKGKVWAIAVVAFSFAALHVGQYWGDWAAILMITIVGLALTLLRSWSGTTMASTVMHYVYNASVTIIPIIIMISSNPAYLKYSAMYQKLDNPTKEALLKESIRKQPDLAVAYNDLAYLYAEQKINLHEALVLVDKALAIDPHVLEYIDTKSEVLFLLGRYEESRVLSQGLLEKDIPADLRVDQEKRIKAVDEKIKSDFSY